jgi:transcriptional regulator with XRE-family HTH domain
MDTSPRLYDYVMAQLRAKRVPQRRVADETGVPFSTLAKIAQGQIKDPSVHTIQVLADYFRGQPVLRCACPKDHETSHDERGPREHELQEAA